MNLSTYSDVFSIGIYQAFSRLVFDWSAGYLSEKVNGSGSVEKPTAVEQIADCRHQIGRGRAASVAASVAAELTEVEQIADCRLVYRLDRVD